MPCLTDVSTSFGLANHAKALQKAVQGAVICAGMGNRRSFRGVPGIELVGEGALGELLGEAEPLSLGRPNTMTMPLIL